MPYYFLCVLLTLSFLLGSLPVVQAASYSFKTLNAPGASVTLPYAINTKGQIVGYYHVNHPRSRGCGTEP